MEGKLSFKIHKWYPTPAEYEFSLPEGKYQAHQDIEAMCCVCGEILRYSYIGTNSQEHYQECLHCKGYTLHRFNQVKHDSNKNRNVARRGQKQEVRPRRPRNSQ